MGKFCKNCGNGLSNEDVFCPNCGSKVGEGSYATDIRIKDSSHSHYASEIRQTANMNIMNSFLRLVYRILKLVDSESARIFLENFNNHKSIVQLNDEAKFDELDSRLGCTIRILLKITAILVVISLLVFVSDIFYLFLVPVCLGLLIVELGVIYAVVKYIMEDREKYIKAINKSLKFLVGVWISAILVMIPFVGLIFLCVAIYKNRKRRKFISKYKRYVYVIIKAGLLGSILYSVGATGYAMSDAARTDTQSNIFFIVGNLGICLAPVAMLYVNRKFYRSERAMGMKFDDIGKLIILVPITWLFLMISIFAHLDTFSIDGTDFLATGDLDIGNALGTDLSSINPDLNLNSDIASASAAPMAASSFADMSSTSVESVNLGLGCSNASTVTDNVDVGSANEVNYDNSTKFNKVPDNIGSTQVTVTDMTGRTQETITQVADNRFEIKDSMGIPNGDVYVNNGTGEAAINIDGETLNVSSNGEVRNLFDPNAGSASSQPDGSVIVRDSMSQYAGGILSDGTIVDVHMNPEGKVFINNVGTSDMTAPSGAIAENEQYTAAYTGDNVNMNDETNISTQTYNKTNVNISDSHGFEQVHIVQTSNDAFVIQDNMNLRIGSATINDISGDMSLFDNLGIHTATITSSGNIQGIDGLTDGHIIHLNNGDMVIQDPQNQTIGHILKNGVITDENSIPIGSIKQ